LETMVGFSCYWPCEVCTSKFGNLLWFRKPFSILQRRHILYARAYRPDLIIAYMNPDKSLFPWKLFSFVKLNVKPCFNVNSGVNVDLLFPSFDVSSWPLAYLGKFIPVPVRPFPDYFKPLCCRKSSRRGESP
jgi:hypothetical protein